MIFSLKNQKYGLLYETILVSASIGILFTLSALNIDASLYDAYDQRIAYYTANYTLKDSSGYGNNLIKKWTNPQEWGGATYKLGNNSFYYDTSDGVVWNNSLVPTSNTLTVDMWVRYEGTDSNTRAGVSVRSNDNNDGFWFYSTGGSVAIASAGGAGTCTAWAATKYKSNWQHYVIAMNDSSWKVYQNNTLVHEQACNVDTHLVNYVTLGGYYTTGHSSANAWVGYIDNVLITNYLYTAQDVSDSWNSGSGRIFFDYAREGPEKTTKFIDKGNAAKTPTTFPTNARNIGTDSNGYLHMAYANGTDIMYRKAHTNGTTISKKVVQTSADKPLILTNSSDALYLFWMKSDNLYYNVSTDSGSTWSTGTTAMDSASALSYPSCVMDSQDRIHCCAIYNTNLLYYCNSSQWNTEVGINTNTSADTNYCDIEVDMNDNIYIVGTGGDLDNLDLWTSIDGLDAAHKKVIDNLGGVGAGYLPSISISPDGKIRVAAIEDADLQVYNSTTKKYNASWTQKELTSLASSNPQIATSPYDDVYVTYSTTQNVAAGTKS